MSKSQGKQLRKKKLYQQGMENIRSIFPEQDNYLCPICLQPKEFDELTLEHVPPRSIVGKEIILICTECNNVAGNQIDSQVAAQFKQNRLIMGLASGKLSEGERSIIEVDGKASNIEVSSGADAKIDIKMLDTMKHTRVIHTKEFFERVSGQEGVTFKIKTASRYNYHAKRAEVGHLKSAYLILVSLFGYSYALNFKTAKIRQQILQPMDDILDIPICTKSDTTDRKGMLVNDTLQAICVFYGHYMLVLPHLSGKLEAYEQTISLYRREQLTKFKGYSQPWAESFMGLVDRNEEVSLAIQSENP